MSKLLHAASVVTVLTVCTVAAITSAAEPGQKRPNVLFIIVDDQSPFDLRLYNSDSKLRHAQY